MKIAVLYYDGFAEFEVVLACLILHQTHDLMAIALEDREYRSEEQQRFLADQLVKDTDSNSVDLLVIPGGNPAPLVENQELKGFVLDLLAKGKKVGGICGGASLLAGFGVLDGKKCTGMTSGVVPSERPSLRQEYGYYANAVVVDAHVVVDGNLITAQGQAYIEFALELARQMGVYQQPGEDYETDLNWLKNRR